MTGGDFGIGRARAVLFARDGADVAIVYETTAGQASAVELLASELRTSGEGTTS